MPAPADLPDPASAVDRFADPASSLERFAELSALLADPFADRPAILSAAGLDAERWQKTQDGWAGRLREGGAVAERFAEVYERTLRALAAPAAPHMAAGGGLPEAQLWRGEAARVGVDATIPSSPSQPPPIAAHPLAATADVDLSAMRPAVPFRQPSSPPNPFGETLEAPTRLPVPVLPFKP